MHLLINITMSSENNKSEHCILAFIKPKAFLFTDRSSPRVHVLNSQLAADMILSSVS